MFAYVEAYVEVTNKHAFFVTEDGIIIEDPEGELIMGSRNDIEAEENKC